MNEFDIKNDAVSASNQQENSPVSDFTNVKNSISKIPIQRKSVQGESKRSASSEQSSNLPSGLKTGMESITGVDLSDVKVHSNSEKPAQLQAHAYTQGSNIFLGPNQETHLPHELGHVVQQKTSTVKPTTRINGQNVNNDIQLENQATELGKSALNSTDVVSAKQSFNSSSGNSIQRFSFFGKSEEQKAEEKSKLDVLSLKLSEQGGINIRDVYTDELIINTLKTQLKVKITDYLGQTNTFGKSAGEKIKEKIEKQSKDQISKSLKDKKEEIDKSKDAEKEKDSQLLEEIGQKEMYDLMVKEVQSNQMNEYTTTVMNKGNLNYEKIAANIKLSLGKSVEDLKGSIKSNWDDEQIKIKLTEKLDRTFASELNNFISQNLNLHQNIINEDSNKDSSDWVKENPINDTNQKVVEQKLQTRKEKDEKLMVKSEIDKVLSESIRKPLIDVAMLKFGVGRSGFWRSKKLNEYRESLKETAKSVARAEIDSAKDIEDEKGAKIGELSTKGAAFENYHKEHAKKIASKSAEIKDSVNEIMQLESEKIVDRVISTEHLESKLMSISKSASFLHTQLKSNAKESEINLIAQKAAQSSAKSIVDENKPKVEDHVRTITKGELASDTEENVDGDETKKKTVSNKRDEIKSSIKAKASEKKIGKKALKQSIDAPGMNSGLTKIAPLINLAIPKDGDSCSLDLTFKIPVQAGSFVSIGIHGDAERDEKSVGLSTGLEIGGGWEAAGLKAGGQVGIYIAANGGNTESALNLYSYGMYREFRASPIMPKAFTNKLWGGSVSEKSEDQFYGAEKWAALIEQTEFKDDENFVETGIGIGGYGGFNAGVLKLEGELSGKRNSRYSKDIITKLTGDDTDNMFGDALYKGGGLKEEDIRKRIDEKVVKLKSGQTSYTVEAGLNMDVNAMGTPLVIGLSGEYTRVPSDPTANSITFGISFGMPFEMGKEAKKWQEKLPQVLSVAATGIKLMSQNFSANSNKSEEGGDKLHKATDALFLSSVDSRIDKKMNDFTKLIEGETEVNEKLAEALKSDMKTEVEGKIGLKSTLVTELEIKKEGDKDWEITLSASETKGISIDSPIAEFEIEKKRKLFEIPLKKHVDKPAPSAAGTAGTGASGASATTSPLTSASSSKSVAGSSSPSSSSPKLKKP